MNGGGNITEEILGSSGAEKLYSIVRDFAANTEDKIIYDLYSGTGTIGQILCKSHCTIKVHWLN